MLKRYTNCVEMQIKMLKILFTSRCFMLFNEWVIISVLVHDLSSKDRIKRPIFQEQVNTLLLSIFYVVQRNFLLENTSPQMKQQPPGKQWKTAYWETQCWGLGWHCRRHLELEGQSFFCDQRHLETECDQFHPFLAGSNLVFVTPLCHLDGCSKFCLPGWYTGPTLGLQY